MEEALDTLATSHKDGSEFGIQLAGKYLTFRLADEEYGLEILKVESIIQMQEVTRVPKTPKYVRGVINLRGKVIPVIKLREKFNMEHHEDTEKTCIIVLQIGSIKNPMTIGIIIDEVLEVLDIGAESIQETPSFGDNFNTDFIMGVGKIGDQVKMLLDIEKILTVIEINNLVDITDDK
jgi:purine-binding chemotaxis protein CheW